MSEPKFLQWIVHPDGTWVWSVEEPQGGRPRGPFKAYALPDANAYDERFWHVRVPVFKAVDPERPMELVSHETHTLRYAKIPSGDGRQWILFDAIAQQPSRCDDLRSALQMLVDKFRAANGSLTLDLAEAILTAERLLRE